VEQGDVVSFDVSSPAYAPFDLRVPVVPFYGQVAVTTTVSVHVLSSTLLQDVLTLVNSPSFAQSLSPLDPYSLAVARQFRSDAADITWSAQQQGYCPLRQLWTSLMFNTRVLLPEQLTAQVLGITLKVNVVGAGPLLPPTAYDTTVESVARTFATSNA
jgi:hypothetical protein